MSNRLLGTGLVVLGLFAGVGCGDSGDGSGGGSADCSAVKGYSELSSAFDKCLDCHTEGNLAAGVPADAFYDSYDGAKANASAIADSVEGGSMPPSDQPQLSDQEKTDLINWARCDAPE